ncbi:MAG: pyridoxal-phosphate dependent enzyme [Desulfobacterales bacterium]
MFGAEVVLHGDELDETCEFTQEFARERDLVLIHPYDNEKVIAGQGTIALEMLESFSDLDLLLISVGGGGLIAGNAIAAKAIRPKIEIIVWKRYAFLPCTRRSKGSL